MEAPSQSEQAYTEIRRRILTLDTRPAERLKEEEWAGHLNIGRLAVREALTRLHGEALVTRGAKGGFFVATMSPADIHEIREVREILETAAVRLAAGRISKAQLRELEATCDDFARMVSKGYHAGACEADLLFHRLLVSASGNKRLLAAYEHCHIPLFHVRMGQSRRYMDDYTTTEREHREIVAAMKAGAWAKAVDQLRAHFARGETEMLAVMSPEPAPPGERKRKRA